jgi:hypothetical protein
MNIDQGTAVGGLAPFRVQILSDVHLEMRDGQLPEVPVTAPYLALLGDIGYPHVGKDYERFLLGLADQGNDEQQQGWKRIFVLAGNHEFYKGHYEKVKPEIAKVCAMRPDKLIFLDRTTVRLVRLPALTLPLPQLILLGRRKKACGYWAARCGRTYPRLCVTISSPALSVCLSLRSFSFIFPSGSGGGLANGERLLQHQVQQDQACVSPILLLSCVACNAQTVTLG